MTLLAIVSFIAAIVTGALGYGFSSIAVPVALLTVTNRVLNPALVLLEVLLNGYVLLVNRNALPLVWKRAIAVAIGVPLGVVVGTAALTNVDPSWLKLATFATLLPLILLQAAGFRRPIRRERTAGAALGAGVGVLYSVTTISGPPLAMFLSNQGLARQEFRVALAVIRTAACLFTAALYLRADLFTAESMSLLPVVLPGVLLGIPVGHWIIRRVREETFRRISMSFDAAIVSFGVSTLLRSLHVVESGAANLLFAAVVTTHLVLLRRFFTRHQSLTRGAALESTPVPQLS